MSKYFRWAALVGVMTTVWAAGHFSPANSKDAGVLVLDPAISSVVSGGYWEHDAKRGIYRVIVANHGWDHVTSEVWIQWIEEVPADHNLVVAISIPVREFHNAQWSIGQPQFRVSARSTIVDLNATQVHSLEKATFTLKLGEPGEYKCDRVN